MKKLLLSMMTLGLTLPTVMAANPVFPSEFQITANSRGVIIDQYIDEDTDNLRIDVTGVTDKDNVTLTFACPEGWTDMIGYKMSVMQMGLDPDKMGPSRMIPLTAFETAYQDNDLRYGFVQSFAVDEPYVGFFFLCLGDEVDETHAFMLYVDVETGDVPGPEDPEFPESFNVTADSKNVSITQYIDEDTDVPTIEVTGSSDKDEVTLTFEIPEGWEGIIGAPVEITADRMKKSRAEWPTLEEFRAAMAGAELTEGDKVVLPVDGKSHFYQCFLYSDGQVDVEHGFAIVSTIEKDEPVVEPDPEFPSELKVTADVEGLKIEQTADEETGNLNISVSGEIEAENVTLTFDLPEEWDGLIGGLMDVAPKSRARAEWPTIEEFTETMVGVELTQGKTLTFPTLAKEESAIMGKYYLYMEDKVDVDNFVVVTFDVKKKENGLGMVGDENASSRYYNLQGVEISTPETGLYIKVAGNKVEKIVNRK